MLLCFYHCELKIFAFGTVGRHKQTDDCLFKLLMCLWSTINWPIGKKFRTVGTLNNNGNRLNKNLNASLWHSWKSWTGNIWFIMDTIMLFFYIIKDNKMIYLYMVWHFDKLYTSRHITYITVCTVAKKVIRTVLWKYCLYVIKILALMWWHRHWRVILFINSSLISRAFLTQ